MKIDIGDTVELNSGSQTFTVDGFIDENSVRVIWFNKNNNVIESTAVNKNCLTLIHDFTTEEDQTLLEDK